MKLSENVYLGKLFDLYGELLSKGQKGILNDYLNNDLTLTEIAENLGISRQSARDSILKAENKLKTYEAKLGFLARTITYEETINELKSKIKKEK